MNVALVKLSSLGDVVHALPVASALRARWPDARLTWVAERPEAAILAGHPALDEIVAVDTRRWRRARRPAEVAAAVRAAAGAGRRLRAARFDVALDLQGLMKSGVLVGLTRAALRVGFSRRRCREPLSALFTNRRVTPPPAARHVVEQYLSLLEPLGLRAPAVEFHVPHDAAAGARIDAAGGGIGLGPGDRPVVLSAGAGRPDKRWPVERFAVLARRLAGEAGVRVIVAWGPGEEPVGRAVVAGAAHLHVALAPPTDLPELAALLRRAAVVVAGDTGPLHLAAALGVPCVALHGPTAAERNGPYGAGHRAISAPDRRMVSIDVDTVFAAARPLLERAGAGARGAGPAP